MTPQTDNRSGITAYHRTVSCSIRVPVGLNCRAMARITHLREDRRAAMDLRRILQAGCLVFVCCTACVAQLTFQSNATLQPAILQRGKGATHFVIENKGDKGLKLALSAGVPVDETSHVALRTAKINLGLEPGTQSLPNTIDPHTAFDIAVDITELTASVAAQIPIFNGNLRLGEIEAVASDVPLNVSLDGAGSLSTPLVLAYGGKINIALKNGDPIPYPIAWNFQVGGMSQSGKLVLPWNGVGNIVLSPQGGAYSLSDFVRPSSRTAQLLVSINVPAVQGLQLQTMRPLPVNVMMQRMDGVWTTIFSDVYIGFFLLIGGVMSLLASSVLPNMLRKSSLHGQINDLAERTSSVSIRVDCYLRVLLRVEWKKIDDLLWSTKPYFLNVRDSLNEVSSDIDRLAKRVAVAERIDDLRSKLETASATAPPSVIEEVDGKLQAAADQMHSVALPDENVTAANRFLDDAAASLLSANDASTMAKRIANNFADLKTRMSTFPFDYSDLKSGLAGVFEVVDENLRDKLADPNNITSAMAYAIDHDVAAIHTALDYVVVRSSTAPGSSVSTRLKNHERELVELLGTMSWQALRDARTLVREMREGIYEEDVLEEIGRPDQAEVVAEPRKPYPYHLVNFCIRFRAPRFESAAAVDRLSWKWEFPFDLTEWGLKVCHYFLGLEQNSKVQSLPPKQPDDGGLKAPAPAKTKLKKLKEREINITVTVQKQKSLNAPTGLESGTAPEERKLPARIEIQCGRPRRESSRSVAEALRFLIAFGVALAGLLSGAAAQLQKLDLVPATLAIIALGFGADAVKNLLTQPSKANASSRSG